MSERGLIGTLLGAVVCRSALIVIPQHERVQADAALAMAEGPLQNLQSQKAS